MKKLKVSKSNNRSSPLLLVELLESFTKKELEGLQYITNCPYFNTDKLVIQLLHVLIKNILGKEWTLEAIQIRLFNRVFSTSASPIKKLDSKQKAKLNAKMSLLTRLAERFLRIEGVEKSESNRCELLMESLLDRKQYRLFNKHLAKEKKSIKNDFKDLYYFKKLHLLEDQELNFFMSDRSLMKSNNIEAVMKSLDLWYLAKRIQYAIVQQNLIKQNFAKPKNSPIPELTETKVFKNCDYEKYPIFILQLAVLELMSNTKYSSYLSLLSLLKQHELNFYKSYIIYCYTIIVNFCIIQIRKGKTEFYQHYVDLHKLLDGKQLLLVNDTISVPRLNNIVAYGCKSGNFEWVSEMIEKYIHLVKQKYRSNAKNYNLGYVAFEKGNYEQAIGYLLQVENFMKNPDINKRILILKSYYELEKHYTEPTAQLFRSLASFIKNHKLLVKKDKIGYKTFVRIFYNLYRLKHKVGTVKLDKLKHQINNAEFISNKLWLLEKVTELEGWK